MNGQKAVNGGARRLAVGLTLVGLAVTLTAWAPRAKAQDTDKAVIRVDHATGKVSLAQRGRPDAPLKTGDRIRLRRPYAVGVEVTNSNSAFHRCEVKADTLKVAELDSLRAFLGALGPYLPGLVAAKSSAAGGVALASDSAKAIAAARDTLARHLAIIDSLIRGPGGIRQIQVTTLSTLEGMRGAPPPPPAQFDISALRSVLTCAPRAGVLAARTPAERCTRLLVVTDLTAAIRAVADAAWALRDTLRVLGVPANIDRDIPRLLESGDKVVDDSEKLVATVYEVEALALRVLYAERELNCGDAVAFTWDAGRTIKLVVAPRAQTQTSRVATAATAKPVELTVQVLPDWIVRPALGLSFVGAPNARYPKFATAEAEGGVQVVESGEQDSRFTYGLVLGLAWRGADWRETGGRLPLALWLPELTVNPTDDVRALGVGAGVSVGIVKLGGGLLWTRHGALRGQAPGQTLPSGGALATRDAYGKPRGYWSLSLTGLPPFIR